MYKKRVQISLLVVTIKGQIIWRKIIGFVINYNAVIARNLATLKKFVALKKITKLVSLKTKKLLEFIFYGC